MPRYARYQLSTKEMVDANKGIPTRLSTFGGERPAVTFRSLKNANEAAFYDYLFELRVGGHRLILSAAEMKQAMDSV